MKRYAQQFLMLAALALLAACAQLGPENPPTGITQTTPNLASGYQIVAQTRLTAATAVKNKLLTAEAGRRALEMTDKATAILDKAVDAYINGQGDAPFRAMEIVSTIIGQILNDIADAESKAKGEKK